MYDTHSPVAVPFDIHHGNVYIHYAYHLQVLEVVHVHSVKVVIQLLQK
jgi:hypothetical protein